MRERDSGVDKPTVKSLSPLMFFMLAMGCDGSNTSTTSADYETLRVKQLVLTDASGKPVVVVTGTRNPNGSPEVVLKDASGVVLKTVEIADK